MLPAVRTAWIAGARYCRYHASMNDHASLRRFWTVRSFHQLVRKHESKVTIKWRRHGTGSHCVRLGSSSQKCDGRGSLMKSMQEWDKEKKNNEQSNDQSILWQDNVVDVTKLADEIRQGIQAYVDDRGQSPPIRLVGILAETGCIAQQEDAALYASYIEANCRDDGIAYETWYVRAKEEGANYEQVASEIQRANESPDVHGVLVYYPIFNSFQGPYKNKLTGVYYKTQDDYLRDMVCPTKDVEGLCHAYNARWLFRDGVHKQPLPPLQRVNGQLDQCPNHQNGWVYPCTALSIVRIIEMIMPSSIMNRLPYPLEGVKVAIINRSEILGRPLAVMLARQGATVFSMDINSILVFDGPGKLKRMSSSLNETVLRKCIGESSIIVSGVPDPNFTIQSDWIQPQTVVINVASSEPNFDEVSLLQGVSGVQYVPHVGKVTVALLEHNLICLHRRYKNTRRN